MSGAKANGGGPGATRAVGGVAHTLKPEQVPLLWQLAGALGVRGLKASLAPLFESATLPAGFVMERPAFERLKLLVRAMELHNDEITGALCEQLRLDTTSSVTVRAGMVELAVAASACDPSRYEALVGCGLIPSTEQKRLAEILDKTTLRVGSEAQVHDFLVKHIEASKAAPAVQESLWSTCRFSYLDAERLVKLAEVKHVPPRWLALACAQ